MPGPGLVGRPPGARLPGALPDPPSDPVPDPAAPSPRSAPALGPLRPAPRGASVPNPRDPPPPRDPPAPRGPPGAPLRKGPPGAPARPGAPRVDPGLGARSGRCPPRFMASRLLGYWPRPAARGLDRRGCTDVQLHGIRQPCTGLLSVGTAARRRGDDRYPLNSADQAVKCRKSSMKKSTSINLRLPGVTVPHWPGLSSSARWFPSAPPRRARPENLRARSQRRFGVQQHHLHVAWRRCQGQHRWVLDPWHLRGRAHPAVAKEMVRSSQHQTSRQPLRTLRPQQCAHRR